MSAWTSSGRVLGAVGLAALSPLAAGCFYPYDLVESGAPGTPVEARAVARLRATEARAAAEVGSVRAELQASAPAADAFQARWLTVLEQRVVAPSEFELGMVSRSLSDLHSQEQQEIVAQAVAEEDAGWRAKWGGPHAGWVVAGIGREPAEAGLPGRGALERWAWRQHWGFYDPRGAERYALREERPPVLDGAGRPLGAAPSAPAAPAEPRTPAEAAPAPETPKAAPAPPSEADDARRDREEARRDREEAAKAREELQRLLEELKRRERGETPPEGEQPK
ncbi:MAG: hypothetical protein L0216_16680 [Planctomycetales bacterium]|nr:hypothetical protein [Planctomycetales bacterium]